MVMQVTATFDMHDTVLDLSVRQTCLYLVRRRLARPIRCGSSDNGAAYTRIVGKRELVRF